jgi:hypothetical protein
LIINRLAQDDRTTTLPQANTCNIHRIHLEQAYFYSSWHETPILVLKSSISSIAGLAIPFCPAEHCCNFASHPIHDYIFKTATHTADPLQEACSLQQTDFEFGESIPLTMSLKLAQVVAVHCQCQFHHH